MSENNKSINPCQCSTDTFHKLQMKVTMSVQSGDVVDEHEWYLPYREMGISAYTLKQQETGIPLYEALRKTILNKCFLHNIHYSLLSKLPVRCMNILCNGDLVLHFEDWF